jgi:hypothetical protein
MNLQFGIIGEVKKLFIYFVKVLLESFKLSKSLKIIYFLSGFVSVTGCNL